MEENERLYEEGFGNSDDISPLHIPLYIRHGLIAEAYELALRLVGGQPADAYHLLTRLPRPPGTIEGPSE